MRRVEPSDFYRKGDLELDPTAHELDEPTELIARHIGKSGWVRPVNGDHDRAWRIMQKEAAGLVEILHERGYAIARLRGDPGLLREALDELDVEAFHRRMESILDDMDSEPFALPQYTERIRAAWRESWKPAARLQGDPGLLRDGPWQQLSDAATPGPWEVTEIRGKRDGYVRGAGGRTVADARYKNGSADAALIVAAVNALRAALAAPLAGPEAIDDLGTAWREAEAALPEGWYLQLYDYGEPGPFLPGPGEQFHTPRYEASANLGILSSPPELFGRSDESPAAALRALTARLSNPAQRETPEGAA